MSPKIEIPETADAMIQNQFLSSKATRIFAGIVCLLALLFAGACGSQKDSREPQWVPAPMAADDKPLPASRGQLVDRVVAWVNDRPVTLSETEEALFHYQNRGKMEPGPVTEARLMEALQTYIDDLLILSRTEEAREQMPSEFIENRIQQALLNMEENEGGGEKLDRLLQSMGKTREDLRDELRKWLRHEWLVTQAVNSQVHVSDADVEAFIEQRKKQGEAVERYHLYHVFCPLSPNMPDADVAEIHAALEKISKEAKSVRDFKDRSDAFARKYSRLGALSGFLDNIEASELQAELVESLRKMQVGETSPPIRSPRGLHVLYLYRKTDPREILHAQRYREARESMVRSLREQSTIQILKPLIGSEL
ncbi:MAG: peptidylprolyl isomerase [Candidatus Sumerlaeia bacterium]